MKTLRLVVLFLFPFTILAQNVPPLVNYQGRLSNPDGSPLATANYPLSFSVFDAVSNGNLIWGPEAFDGGLGAGHGAVVPVVQGYFNVLLGPSDVNGRSLSAAFNGTSRFIEVTVSSSSPIAPRQQILTSPYAFQAGTAALATSVASGIGLTNANITGNSTISGNGAGLTSVPAGSLTGTIASARIPASVAFLGNNQNFTGQNTFAANVGVGTNNPFAQLHVFDTAPLVALVDGSSVAGAWLALRANGSFGGTNWHLISTASGNGEGAGKLLFGVGPFPDAVNNDVLTLMPNGFVGIGTTAPGTLLQVGSAICTGLQWLNASDRNLKEDFDAISPRAVLEKVSAMPITEWKYKTDQDGTKHLGPMAQDFHAAFGLNGADDKHIATADEEGVALAAIQGLNQKLEEKDAQVQALNRRVNELEATIKALAGKK